MKIALESRSLKGTKQYILFNSTQDFLDWWDYDGTGDDPLNIFKVNWVFDVVDVLPSDYHCIGCWNTLDESIVNMLRL